MTCKYDCIHYNACKAIFEAQGYSVDGDCEYAEKRCNESESKHDYVKVVLCAECKWSRCKTKAESEINCEEVRICTNAEATESGYNSVFESHYCSYGERKENK